MDVNYSTGNKVNTIVKICVECQMGSRFTEGLLHELYTCQTNTLYS